MKGHGNVKSSPPHKISMLSPDKGIARPASCVMRRLRQTVQDILVHEHGSVCLSSTGQHVGECACVCVYMYMCVYVKMNSNATSIHPSIHPSVIVCIFVSLKGGCIGGVMVPT